MVQQKWKFFLLAIIAPAFAYADEADLVAALQKTYSACIGIDANLFDLKKMAGINTAITGVGTGLGVGAVAVGIAKENVDKSIDEEIKNLRDYSYGASPDEEVDDTDVFEADVIEELKNIVSKDGHPVKSRIDQERADRLKQLVEKSKSLGNWRTGLLAGNTVTNVAGAIIAGKNTTDGDLQNQIDNCKNAISELRRARGRARIDGVDVGEANKIISACEGFETVDISKINTRAKGAMVSGIVGATTGLTGTITSGIANSDSVRNQGEGGTRTDKEKNLNTASNVLAGASTVASGVATVFNATQISAIKKVADVATKCTEALK